MFGTPWMGYHFSVVKTIIDNLSNKITLNWYVSVPRSILLKDLIDLPPPASAHVSIQGNFFFRTRPHTNPNLSTSLYPPAPQGEIIFQRLLYIVCGSSLETARCGRSPPNREPGWIEWSQQDRDILRQRRLTRLSESRGLPPTWWALRLGWTLVFGKKSVYLSLQTSKGFQKCDAVSQLVGFED